MYFRDVFSKTVSSSILSDFFTKNEKEKEESQKIAEDLGSKTETLPSDEVALSKEEIEKKLLVSAKIIERMVNLNTYDDIVKDYRFYEDPADEFRENEGSLLPLWTFRFEGGNGLEVTDLQWSPKYTDLFGVTYGSFDFYTKSKSGFLCLYSLKNPSYPEYVCSAWCGILCLDIHPSYPHMIVVGLYDGNIAVYNLHTKSSSPCFQSCAGSGKHADAVWQVCWAKDNLDGYLNFYSCSGDGRVTNWTIVKTSLWHSDELVVSFDKSLTNTKDISDILMDGARAIAFRPDEDNIYLVGTDEGDIYLSTTEYSSAYLMTYHSHVTPVNSVMWNPFYPLLFISCASEPMVHIWHKDLPSPILSFDIGFPVGDVAWAPYSSTVFAVVTGDGGVRVFDIHVNKYRPICRQVLMIADCLVFVDNI